MVFLYLCIALAAVPVVTLVIYLALFLLLWVCATGVVLIQEGWRAAINHFTKDRK